MQTVLRQLVDDRLDGNLDGLIAGLRVAGWGWRRIAGEVSRRTSTDISYMTLRSWYPDDRRTSDSDEQVPA